MQLLSAIGDKTDYSWSQSLRFFAIGALKASAYAMVPVIVAVWHNSSNYTDATDWGLVWKLAVSGVGLRLYSYWNEHKALLKMPPFWAIPEEFEPIKITTIEKSEHATVVTKQTDSGIVTTEMSPHTTTTVTVAAAPQPKET